MTTNRQSNHGFPPGSDRARCRPRAPTRRPLFGVRTVLGRSNVERAEGFDQFTRLHACCCSNSRSAGSLACCIADCQSARLSRALLCLRMKAAPPDNICGNLRSADATPLFPNPIGNAAKSSYLNIAFSERKQPCHALPSRKSEKSEKSEKCDGISHISHLEIRQKCPFSHISHISHQKFQ